MENIISMMSPFSVMNKVNLLWIHNNQNRTLKQGTFMKCSTFDGLYFIIDLKKAI